MKLTFFQLFAGIVDHSKLTGAEIARRVNEGGKGTSLAACPDVHRATISRIYRGIDLPGAFLLYRIALFGLSQSEDQCKALEQLRQVEAKTHTTSHHKVLPSTEELPRKRRDSVELREAEQTGVIIE